MSAGVAGTTTKPSASLTRPFRERKSRAPRQPYRSPGMTTSPSARLRNVKAGTKASVSLLRTTRTAAPARCRARSTSTAADVDGPPPTPSRMVVACRIPESSTSGTAFQELHDRRRVGVPNPVPLGQYNGLQRGQRFAKTVVDNHVVVFGILDGLLPGDRQPFASKP